MKIKKISNERIKKNIIISKHLQWFYLTYIFIGLVCTAVNLLLGISVIIVSTIFIAVYRILEEIDKLKLEVRGK